MSTEVQIVLQARTPSIAEWVEQCAKGELDFGELCQRVAAQGYKTTSLYEMVCAVEWELKQEKAKP